MPDPTREAILTLELAGITFVSDKNRADSRTMTASHAKVLQTASGIGILLTETPVGTQIEARTANNVYRLLHAQRGLIEISGHPKYCPHPVSIQIGGTCWLDQSSESPFLAPGMSIQFVDRSGRSVVTSKIQSIQVVS